MRYWVSLILLVLFVIPSSAAMIDVGSVLWPRTYDTKSDTSVSYILDGATDKAALVFVVPKTGTLTGVGWGTRLVTTSESLDICLETVDVTTGFPSGTLKGTGACAVRPTVATETYYEDSFTTAQSVTQGEILSVVIKFTAFVAGNVQIKATGMAYTSTGLPYGAHWAATAYAKIETNPINVVLLYNDGSRVLVDVIPPSLSGTTTAYNNASASDEYALKFTPPVTMRVEGWWGCLFGGTGGAFDVVLYDSDGSTVLASGSYDGDISSAPASIRFLYGSFPTVTLQANTTYYLSVKPTTTTNVTLTVFTFGSVEVVNSLSGNGAHLATRVDGGTWTATTTKRPWIGLKVSGVDSGGGGSYVIGG